MLIAICQIVWFMLPACVANMMPVLVKKLPVLNYPLDGGKTFFGKRITGDHKTWRGLIFGVLAAVLIALLQMILAPYLSVYLLIEYSFVNTVVVGLLLGSGALIGDAVKSFVKRQIKISEGKSWPPFDQIDWIIGAFIFTEFYFSLSPVILLGALLLLAPLHPLMHYLGYILGLTKEKI